MSTPWADGYYKFDKGFAGKVFDIKGSKGILKSLHAPLPDEEEESKHCTLTYGDFGEAHSEVAASTGKAQA